MRNSHQDSENSDVVLLAFNLVLVALVCMMIGISSAYADDNDAAQIPLAQPQQIGNVSFVSGGIGEDESNAIKAQASNFDLRVTETQRDGAYTSGAIVILTDNKTREQFTIGNTGPLLYVNLPNGAYTLKAVNGSEEITRQIKVNAHKPVNLNLVWQELT